MFFVYRLNCATPLRCSDSHFGNERDLLMMSAWLSCPLPLVRSSALSLKKEEREAKKGRKGEKGAAAEIRKIFLDELEVDVIGVFSLCSIELDD